MEVKGFLCGSYKDVNPFLLACFTGSSVCVIIAGSRANSGASVHGRVDKACFSFPSGTTLPNQQQLLPLQAPLNTRLLLLFSETHQALLPFPSWLSCQLQQDTVRVGLNRFIGVGWYSQVGSYTQGPLTPRQSPGPPTSPPSPRVARGLSQFRGGVGPIEIFTNHQGGCPLIRNGEGIGGGDPLGGLHRPRTGLGVGGGAGRGGLGESLEGPERACWC